MSIFLFRKPLAMVLACCLIGALVDANPVFAQDVLQGTANDSDILQAAYQRRSRSLIFKAQDNKIAPFAVSQKPVMTWTSLDGWSGGLFAWTGNGRVQVVGCIGSQVQKENVEFFLEMHSFTNQAVTPVKLDDTQTWDLPVQIPQFQPVPDSPIPASTPARRSIQLRSLARSFSVGMQISDGNVERELRRLSRPVVREISAAEPTDKHDVLDSALFAFVSSSGTDPEAFLLLEARKVDGKLTWTYRAARFTTREIWMFHRSEEVWRVPAISDWTRRPRIATEYFFRTESTPPTELQRITFRHPVF